MTTYDLSMTNRYDYNTQIAIAYLSTTVEIAPEDLNGFQSLCDGSVEITPDHMNSVIHNLIQSRNTASWLDGYNEHDLQNRLIEELIKLNQTLIKKELGIEDDVFAYIHSEKIRTGSGINWTQIYKLSQDQCDRIKLIAKLDLTTEGRFRIDLYEDNSVACTDGSKIYNGRVHNYRD